MRTAWMLVGLLGCHALAAGCRSGCRPCASSPPATPSAAARAPAPTLIPTPTPTPTPAPAPGPGVLLEMALYAVPEERFVGSLAGRFGDGVVPLVMDATEARGWQMALTTEGGAEILQMPSVVTQAGDEATVEVGERLPGGAWQGVTAWAAPRVEGGRILLDLVVTQRPVAHDADAVQQVSTRGARLASGQSLLLMSAAPKAGRRLVVVGRATVLPGS